MASVRCCSSKMSVYLGMGVCAYVLDVSVIDSCLCKVFGCQKIKEGVMIYLSRIYEGINVAGGKRSNLSYTFAVDGKFRLMLRRVN